MANNKVYSKTMANSIFAMCYIEECINEPGQKMYRYYYWNKRDREYSQRTFILEAGLLANHLMYNEPELLQQLLNECRLYRYVIRTVRKYKKAVDKQTEELCKADKEMELALRLGDTDKYYALERNNRFTAEEMSRSILYGR